MISSRTLELFDKMELAVAGHEIRFSEQTGPRISLEAARVLIKSDTATSSPLAFGYLSKCEYRIKRAQDGLLPEKWDNEP